MSYSLTPFVVTYHNVNYITDLGPSSSAKNARLLGIEYIKNKNYQVLKSLFDHLLEIVTENNTFKKNACLAACRFAYSVLSQLNSPYKKLFVANAVVTILEKANVEIPPFWLAVEKTQTAKIVTLGLDREKIKEAGLILNKEWI